MSSDDLDIKIAQALNKVSMAMKQERWEQQGPHGLNPAQGRILELLANEATPPRIGEIARMLGVSAASMTDSVKSLIEKGLVQKQPCLRDKRAQTISLTASGKRLLRQMGDADSLVYEALDALSDEEQAVMHRSLMKMIFRLQQQGRIDVARLCVTCSYFRPWKHGAGEAPHHCDLVNAPLAASSLRIDCPEHEAADPVIQQKNYKLTIEGKPIS